jgi:hypothetical protein
MKFSFVFRPKLVLIGSIRSGISEKRETEEKSGFSDRDFQNYQRILTQQHHFSTSLQNIMVILQPAGIVGLYAIHKNYQFSFLLSALMVFVTGLLFVQWFREHHLKNQAIRDLETAGIRFPEVPKWKGVSGWAWKIFFVIAIGMWLVLSILFFNLFI